MVDNACELFGLKRKRCRHAYVTTQYSAWPNRTRLRCEKCGKRTTRARVEAARKASRVAVVVRAVRAHEA